MNTSPRLSNPNGRDASAISFTEKPDLDTAPEASTAAGGTDGGTGVDGGGPPRHWSTTAPCAVDLWVAIPIAAVLAGAALLMWQEVPQEWARGRPSVRQIMLGGFALLTAVAWLLLGATELLMRLASLAIAIWRVRASAHPSAG